MGLRVFQYPARVDFVVLLEMGAEVNFMDCAQESLFAADTITL